MSRKKKGWLPPSAPKPHEQNPKSSEGDSPPAEDLPALIPVELRQEMVDKLGQQKVSLIERTIMKVSLYRSDWPPPDYIADAENALPGSGQKIIDAVAAKIAIQNRIAEKKADGSERRMNRGQYIGLATIAMGVAAATYISTLTASFFTMMIAIVMILATVGGPSVARVIADRIYMERMKPSLPRDKTKSRN